MDTPPLPESGPGRELLLAALATYSSECEPPELTPGCPYYELTTTGPQCAEQCIDLLADQGGASSSRTPSIVIDSEYSARQRTHRVRRRDLGPPAPAFDAKQIHLADAEKLTTHKRTAALVIDLRELLLTPPDLSSDPADRRYRIVAAWDELDRRGVPADLLVRQGLALSLAFTGLIVVGARPSPDIGDETFTEPWRELLNHIASPAQNAPGVDRAVSLPGDKLIRVAQALGDATRDELIELTPPPPTSVDAVTGPMPAGDPQATWLHERFGQTYIDEWTPTSRALEWQYLHGQHSGCCPPEVMRERYVAAGDLTEHLADHAASDLLASPDERRRGPQVRSSDFAGIAAGHLEAGDYQAAVNLFRALVELNPDDTEARNNLGFCLMPIDTAAALKQLQLAESQADAFYAPTAANVTFALYRLGQHEQALAYGRDALEQCSSADPQAWLWLAHADGGLRLTESSIDVAGYLTRLLDAIEAAKA